MDAFVALDPGDYPVRLDFQGSRCVARWRPLLHWLLAAPHLLLVYLLLPVAAGLTVVSLVTIVATKRVPPGIHNVLASILRHQIRVATFLLAMRTTYPSLAFRPASADPGDDPHVTLHVPDPGERCRWAPLYGWLLAIPHYVVLLALGGAVFVLMVAACGVVVLTGRFPLWGRVLFVRYARYAARVLAHAGLMRDEYPPLRLA